MANELKYQENNIRYIFQYHDNALYIGAIYHEDYTEWSSVDDTNKKMDNSCVLNIEYMPATKFKMLNDYVNKTLDESIEIKFPKFKSSKTDLCITITTKLGYDMSDCTMIIIKAKEIDVSEKIIKTMNYHRELSDKKFEELTTKYNILEKKHETLLNDFALLTDILKSDFQKITDVINEHDTQISEHQSIINISLARINNHNLLIIEHDKKILRHHEILNNHDDVLNEHDQLLNDHNDVLHEHDQLLDDHNEVLHEHADSLNENLNKHSQHSEDIKGIVKYMNKQEKQLDMNCSMLNDDNVMLKKIVLQLNKQNEKLNSHNQILNKDSNKIKKIMIQIDTNTSHINEYNQILLNHANVLNQHVANFDEYNEIINNHAETIDKHVTACSTLEKSIDANRAKIKSLVYHVDSIDAYLAKTKPNTDVIITK